jgi:hypothetical protein
MRARTRRGVGGELALEAVGVPTREFGLPGEAHGCRENSGEHGKRGDLTEHGISVTPSALGLRRAKAPHASGFRIQG